MIIVDSPFHVTFSSFSEPPTFACNNKCKKIFWGYDLDNRSKEICPQCGGEICSAVEGVHFTVLSRSNRDLKFSDFKKYADIDNDEKKHIQKFIDSGVNITHLSTVKEKFQERALKEWCNRN